MCGVIIIYFWQHNIFFFFSFLHLKNMRISVQQLLSLMLSYQHLTISSKKFKCVQIYTKWSQILEFLHDKKMYTSTHKNKLSSSYNNIYTTLLKYLHQIKFPYIQLSHKKQFRWPEFKSGRKVFQYTFMSHKQNLLYISVTNLSLSITNLKPVLSAILMNIIIAL